MAKFTVFRFDPEKDKKPYWQTYEFEARKGMTVLEGILHIQQNLDGSLAFRTACRAGICGSCAMHINGLYRLACETQISALHNNVKIRPLAHLRVIKDLMTDMKPFWDKYKYIKPYLIPGDPNPEKERIQTPDQREKLNELIDCILCGCCYSSCTMTMTNPEYLGPSAFLNANRFIMDSRDGASKERLRLVDTDFGIWRCHTIFNCQKACPKDLNPPASIANLKRKTLKDRKNF